MKQTFQKWTDGRMRHYIDLSYISAWPQSVDRLLLVLLQSGDDIEIVDLKYRPWEKI